MYFAHLLLELGRGLFLLSQLTIEDIFSFFQVSLLLLNFICLNCKHAQLNVNGFVSLLPIFNLEFKLLIGLGGFLVAARHICDLIITILDFLLPIFDIFIQCNLQCAHAVEFLLLFFQLLLLVLNCLQQVIVLVADFEFMAQVSQRLVRCHQVVNDLSLGILDFLPFVHLLHIESVKLAACLDDHLRSFLHIY